MFNFGKDGKDGKDFSFGGFDKSSALEPQNDELEKVREQVEILLDAKERLIKEKNDLAHDCKEFCEDRKRAIESEEAIRKLLSNTVTAKNLMRDELAITKKKMEKHDKLKADHDVLRSENARLTDDAKSNAARIERLEEQVAGLRKAAARANSSSEETEAARKADLKKYDAAIAKAEEDRKTRDVVIAGHLATINRLQEQREQSQTELEETKQQAKKETTELHKHYKKTAAPQLLAENKRLREDLDFALGRLSETRLEFDTLVHAIRTTGRVDADLVAGIALTETEAGGETQSETAGGDGAPASVTESLFEPSTGSWEHEDDAPLLWVETAGGPVSVWDEPVAEVATTSTGVQTEFETETAATTIATAASSSSPSSAISSLLLALLLLIIILFLEAPGKGVYPGYSGRGAYGFGGSEVESVWGAWVARLALFVVGKMGRETAMLQVFY